MEYFIELIGIVVILGSILFLIMAFNCFYLDDKKVMLRDKINTCLLIILVITTIVFTVRYKSVTIDNKSNTTTTSVVGVFPNSYKKVELDGDPTTYEYISKLEICWGRNEI